MCAQTIGEQVRWQDLQVRSETDIVFDIAKMKGWEDCEVFGSGDMITQPQESMGWKLIPADQYKYSIPMQAVARLHEVINAGVRVQGVIIADDTRREEPAPTPLEPEEQKTVAPPAPARQEVQAPELPQPARAEELRTSPPAAPAVPSVDPLADAEAVVSFAGKALLVLIRIAVMGSIVALGIYALFHYFWITLILGFMILIIAGSGSSTGTGGVSGVDYDPKLVILVDDGKGGTTWISLYTWYD